jgi:hypothetical protein
MPSDFFIGYEPITSRRRMFLASGALFTFVAIAVALVITSFQSDPGRTSVMSSNDRGNLIPSPVPLVERVNKNPLLLVNEGKIGFEMAARPVQASMEGIEYRRGNLSLFEVASLQMSTTQPAETVELGESATFKGEIIDPKCFSGAMKPGNGATHKSCAALCLRGGIPPMLLTEDGTAYLVLDARGNRFVEDELDQIAALVARPIVATGTLGTIANQKAICVNLRDLKPQ